MVTFFSFNLRSAYDALFICTLLSAHVINNPPRSIVYLYIIICHRNGELFSILDDGST